MATAAISAGLMTTAIPAQTPLRKMRRDRDPHFHTGEQPGVGLYRVSARWAEGARGWRGQGGS